MAQTRGLYPPVPSGSPLRSLAAAASIIRRDLRRRSLWKFYSRGQIRLGRCPSSGGNYPVLPSFCQSRLLQGQGILRPSRRSSMAMLVCFCFRAQIRTDAILINISNKIMQDRSCESANEGPERATRMADDRRRTEPAREAYCSRLKAISESWHPRAINTLEALPRGRLYR